MLRLLLAATLLTLGLLGPADAAGRHPVGGSSGSVTCDGICQWDQVASINQRARLDNPSLSAGGLYSVAPTPSLANYDGCDQVNGGVTTCRGSGADGSVFLANGTSGSPNCAGTPTAACTVVENAVGNPSNLSQIFAYGQPATNPVDAVSLIADGAGHAAPLYDTTVFSFDLKAAAAARAASSGYGAWVLAFMPGKFVEFSYGAPATSPEQTPDVIPTSTCPALSGDSRCAYIYPNSAGQQPGLPCHLYQQILPDPQHPSRFAIGGAACGYTTGARMGGQQFVDLINGVNAFYYNLCVTAGGGNTWPCQAGYAGGAGSYISENPAEIGNVYNLADTASYVTNAWSNSASTATVTGPGCNPSPTYGGYWREIQSKDPQHSGQYMDIAFSTTTLEDAVAAFIDYQSFSVWTNLSAGTYSGCNPGGVHKRTVIISNGGGVSAAIITPVGGNDLTNGEVLDFYVSGGTVDSAIQVSSYGVQHAYYVVNANGTNYQISATQGGSAIITSTNSTGTITSNAQQVFIGVGFGSSCPDYDTGDFYSLDTAGYIYRMNLNSSDGPGDWTQMPDPGSSGDAFPSDWNVSQTFVGCEILPASRPGSGGYKNIIFQGVGEFVIQRLSLLEPANDQMQSIISVVG